MKKIKKIQVVDHHLLEQNVKLAIQDLVIVIVNKK